MGETRPIEQIVGDAEEGDIILLNWGDAMSNPFYFKGGDENQVEFYTFDNKKKGNHDPPVERRVYFLSRELNTFTKILAPQGLPVTTYEIIKGAKED